MIIQKSKILFSSNILWNLRWRQKLKVKLEDGFPADFVSKFMDLQ